MKKPLKKYFRELFNRKCIAACIYIAIGVLMLVFRAQTPEIICRILGVGLCILGIYNLIYHIIQDEVVLGLPFDIMLIVAGAVLTAFARGIASFVAILLGVFMIFKAVFGMQDALIARKSYNASWIVDFIYAVITVVMGVILVINPLSGLNYLAVAMGIVLIADGILGLAALILTIKLDRNAVDESDCVIDAETVETDGDN